MGQILRDQIATVPQLCAAEHRAAIEYVATKPTVQHSTERALPAADIVKVILLRPFSLLEVHLF